MASVARPTVVPTGATAQLESPRDVRSADWAHQPLCKCKWTWSTISHWAQHCHGQNVRPWPGKRWLQPRLNMPFTNRAAVSCAHLDEKLACAQPYSRRDLLGLKSPWVSARASA